MASYLRSWLSLTGIITSSDDISTPTILEISPPPSDDNEDEDDQPSMFPSLSSAQRLSPPSLEVPRILTDSELMPPPPAPHLASRQPGVLTVSKSSSLTVPNTTQRPVSKKRGRVVLSPGHSPLDWANLKTSGEDLRVCMYKLIWKRQSHLFPCKGVDTLTRIPPSVLKSHNKRDDAWTAINGNIYNITPYLPFHPGGESELMRVAGRDGTKLFSESPLFRVPTPLY